MGGEAEKGGGGNLTKDTLPKMWFLDPASSGTFPTPLWCVSSQNSESVKCRLSVELRETANAFKIGDSDEEKIPKALSVYCHSAAVLEQRPL